MLQELGLESELTSLKSKKASVDPAVAAARTQQKAAKLAEAQANRRSSSRLAENGSWCAAGSQTRS